MAFLILIAAPPAAALSAQSSMDDEISHLYPPRAPQAGAGSSSTSQTIPDPTIAGNRQNGAIFIRSPHGRGIGRCSGTSVNAPNLSVVITAGHCVHGDGHWYMRKWVFVPGYHNGQRPFGTFTAKWLGATPQWISSGNHNFDVGAAVVGRNERGQRLAAAVGGAGIAWDLPRQQIFDVFGYPAADPFDGATLRLCPQASYGGHSSASFYSRGPLDLAVQCNVSGGASGGGWIISGNILNGVSTSGYSGDPTTTYGPYFGREIGSLFTRAGRVK